LLRLLRRKIGQGARDKRHPLARHIAFGKFDDPKVERQHERQYQCELDRGDAALILPRLPRELTNERETLAHHEL
jgi:hypothetical protein